MQLVLILLRRKWGTGREWVTWDCRKSIAKLGQKIILLIPWKPLLFGFVYLSSMSESRVQLFVTPWTIQSIKFSSKNTEVGSLSLLQGTFQTQGLNPGFPHCRHILYQMSHQEALLIICQAAKSHVDKM